MILHSHTHKKKEKISMQIIYKAKAPVVICKSVVYRRSSLTPYIAMSCLMTWWYPGPGVVLDCIDS